MALNSGYVYRHRVRPEEAGASVIDHHAERFPHPGRDGWLASIREGRVLRNGVRAGADELLRVGDAIEFHRPPWDEAEVPLGFEVLLEDEHVLVVAKPAGLQVLPAGPFFAHTLLTVVRASAPSRAESSPVHRLGRGTSGIVLFGKSALARASLSAQFRGVELCKTYLAIVDGCALATSSIARQTIGSIAHGPLDIWVAQPGGKASTTRIRVLARDRARQRSLVAAQPITGRPDQIRIHLAAQGAPLSGDPLFGPGGGAKSDATPGQGGYRLHATALRFRHPATGAWVKVRSRPRWSELAEFGCG